jgi:hypothetical protein
MVSTKEGPKGSPDSSIERHAGAEREAAAARRGGSGGGTMSRRE